jgi:hypothetical protein
VGTNVSEEHTASIFRVEVKMEAVCSSETLRPAYQATLSNNPEEHIMTVVKVEGGWK